MLLGVFRCSAEHQRRLAQGLADGVPQTESIWAQRLIDLPLLAFSPDAPFIEQHANQWSCLMNLLKYFDADFAADWLDKLIAPNIMPLTYLAKVLAYPVSKYQTGATALIDTFPALLDGDVSQGNPIYLMAKLHQVLFANLDKAFSKYQDDWLRILTLSYQHSNSTDFASALQKHLESRDSAELGEYYNNTLVALVKQIQTYHQPHLHHRMLAFYRAYCTGRQRVAQVGSSYDEKTDDSEIQTMPLSVSPEERQFIKQFLEAISLFTEIVSIEELLEQGQAMQLGDKDAEALVAKYTKKLKQKAAEKQPIMSEEKLNAEEQEQRNKQVQALQASWQASDENIREHQRQRMANLQHPLDEAIKQLTDEETDARIKSLENTYITRTLPLKTFYQGVRIPAILIANSDRS